MSAHDRVQMSMKLAGQDPRPRRARLALALALLVGTVILLDALAGLVWLWRHLMAGREAGAGQGIQALLPWLPPLLAKLLYAVLMLARCAWLFAAQALWCLWFLRFGWEQAGDAALPMEFHLGLAGQLLLAAIGLWIWRCGVLRGWRSSRPS